MNTDKPTQTASDYAKAMSDKSAQPENVRETFDQIYDDITWDDHADALWEDVQKGKALFDHSKLAIDFDPYRSFESVDEAIAYCEKQPEPITAVMAIACANILLGEFGFASEVVRESQTMAICCPDVMPDNRD